MRPSLRDIAVATAGFYKIPMSNLMEGTGKVLAHRRQLAMYLSREISGYSYPQIGRFYGRDHTTALFAFRQVTERLQDGNCMADAMAIASFATALCRDREARERELARKLWEGPIAARPHTPNACG